MPENNKRRIEYIAVSELMTMLHPANPKGHDIPMIIQSFVNHGFVSSGTLDERTGKFLCGHGRTEALHQMLEQQMDAPRYIDVRKGDWYCPVECGYESLNDAQALAYIAIDNQSTIAGDWDKQKLAELLTAVNNSEEIELSTSGFDESQLKEIMTELANQQEPATDPGAQVDRAGELQEKWQVKRGDVWQVGNHEIMCGDSSISKDVDWLLGEVQPNLCHADPPYGMGKEKDGIQNDNLYREKLDEFQMAWWDSCRSHLMHNASVYIWGNAADVWRLWYCGGLRDSERLTIRNEIVWDKGNGEGMLSDAHRMYPTASERCLFFMLGEQQMSTNADNYWDGWENIRLYLKEQKDLMSWDIATCKRLAGHSESSGCHWFDKSQWTMLTREVYESWQRAASNDAFKREYDDIKREYDDIKREYDDIKREWDATRAHFDNAHDNMTDVWQYPRVDGAKRWGHATPKPVDMIERIIKSSSREYDVIYDPFLGSGTTTVACEQTGRIGYGMEIAPEYVAVSLERLAGMGLEPVRVENKNPVAGVGGGHDV